MKVGLYTIHAIDNFGAQLQAFATQHFLQRNGYECEVVNLFSKEEELRVSYRYPWHSLKGIALNLYAMFMPSVIAKKYRQRKFNKLLNLSRRYYSSEELQKSPQEYDVHLVGSDQVWNFEGGRPENNPFFLHYLPKKARKISYASSFGKAHISDEYTPFLREALGSFDKLSSRENDGVELIRNVTGKKAQLVLDPTFLLSSDEWATYCSSKPIIQYDYILCYGFAITDYWQSILDRTSQLLGMPVVAISIALHIPYKVDRFYQAAGPAEFLNLIKNARCVLTGSFHGMALALNFKKDFIVVRQGTRMSRMESLLNMLGLEEWIISDADELSNLINNKRQVDYSYVQPLLDKEVSISKLWLLDALKE